MHAARILAPGEEGVVRPQTAVLLDRIGTQLPRYASGGSALGHVEDFLILGYEDAVWLGRIEGDARDGVLAVLLRIGAQHRAMVELLDFRLVPVAFVHRIGKPDAAFAVDREIVRRAQFPAIEAIGDDDILAVRVEAHDSPAARAAAEEPAVFVEREAVRAVGAGAPLVDRAGPRLVAQDAVLADLSDVDVFAVPDRTFGDELLGIGLEQQFKFPRHVQTSLSTTDTHRKHECVSSETRPGSPVFIGGSNLI